MGLTTIDWVIMAVYFAFVLGIGAATQALYENQRDFFLAGRSIPAWVQAWPLSPPTWRAGKSSAWGLPERSMAFLTSHFYWIGAIPAMVFVGIFMMPFYYGSRARSVPEYLRLRFDEKTRGLNAVSFATMTIFSSGISMYAMAKLIQTLHFLDAPFRAPRAAASVDFSHRHQSCQRWWCSRISTWAG